MSDLIIRELDKGLVHQANSNSFNGTRGDGSEHDYHVYANRIIEWPISDEKKQKLLDKLYEKWSAMLRQEAQHVSVMVAGPAKYNAKRLDHSDQILRLSSEFVEWFKGLEEQVKQGQRKDDKSEYLIDMVEFCKQPDNPCDPTSHLTQLAAYDLEAFIRYYEELYPTYKWRKNSTIYKLYEKAKSGELTEIKKEVFFEDANLTAYTEGDRAFIKFLMRPQRQLIVALKSRGFWWNNHVDAWSTYLSKLDKEWVATISERYAKYI